MQEVIVVMGSGAMGQAIARRVGAGKQILLGDLKEQSAEETASHMRHAGFQAQARAVDVTSRASVEALAKAATAIGSVVGLIHTAGVSPSSAPPHVIFKVDLYGAALVLEVFRDCIARGGSGVVVSSQAGHRLDPLSADESTALATTPADELLELPMLQPRRVTDALRAYEIAKHGSSLRVAAESVRWAQRGARLNAISPGIVGSPLSEKELAGAHAAGYQRMIEQSASGRVGTPDEVGAIGALLMGPEGAFISGSDLLMDGGVTAAFRYGGLTL